MRNSSSKTSCTMIYTRRCNLSCNLSKEACFEQICSSWAFGKIVDLLMICTISPKSLNWRKCHFYYILYYKLHFHQKPLVYKFAQNRHLWIYSYTSYSCAKLQLYILLLRQVAAIHLTLTYILVEHQSFHHEV